MWVFLLFGLDAGAAGLNLLGAALVLAAALGYAAGAIMIHRRYADGDPLGVATSAMLVTGIVLVVPTVIALPHRHLTLTLLMTLSVLRVVCTGMTLAMFYRLIVNVGPARAALAFYLSPAFALAMGSIFLHERITIGAVVGMALIVGGSVLAARRHPQGERPK